MNRMTARRARSFAGVFVLGLLLAACMLAPGRFTSGLDVKRDGRFRFVYAGELHVLPLMKAEQNRTFTPEPCTDSQSGPERPCRREEIDQQRNAWQARRERDRQSSAAMAAMLGGVDFDDPEAPGDIAERLMRQKGWRRADYRGNGTFDVTYSIDSRLDHEFAFPSIEGFSWSNAFVTISPRSDGTARIDAPGFSPGSGMNGMGGALVLGTMMGGAMSMKETSGSLSSSPPTVEGTFTVTTDAPILANNTDEGPEAVPVGQVLSWTINSRAPAPPTALLQLDRD